METTRWTIDPAHSEIGFKIKHLMIANVRGKFNKYRSTIETEGNNFANAKIKISIDASSIDTGDNKRDFHLKSADFFDAENYKEIIFTSVKINGMDGSFELWGDLTIKNSTKQIKLNVDFGGIMKDPGSGKEKAGFTITGKIDRTLWGLKWNSQLDKGMMLSDEVMIMCEVELVSETEGKNIQKKKSARETEIT